MGVKLSTVDSGISGAGNRMLVLVRFFPDL